MTDFSCNMICPTCRTEYLQGFTMCADCAVPLVNEFSLDNRLDIPLPRTCGDLEKVFETWDSYEFIDAGKMLRDAGIPFTGDEWYSGEFRASRREQAPYLWSILVPADRVDEALKVLDERMSGEPLEIPPVETEDGATWHRFLLIVLVAIAAAFWALFFMKA